METTVLFLKLETGYCGQTGYELIEVAADMLGTQEFHDELSRVAYEHAESYGVEMCASSCDDVFCELEHPETTGIDFFYEKYVPEQHDDCFYKVPKPSQWY